MVFSEERSASVILDHRGKTQHAPLDMRLIEEGKLCAKTKRGLVGKVKVKVKMVELNQAYTGVEIVTGFHF